MTRRKLLTFTTKMSKNTEQLEQKTYNVRLYTLIAIIGGTVSICVTVLVYLNTIERRFNDINRDIKDVNLEISSLKNWNNEIKSDIKFCKDLYIVKFNSFPNESSTNNRTFAR